MALSAGERSPDLFRPNMSNRSTPISIRDNAVSSLPTLRIVLLGKTGAGKSATGNTILGQKEFRSETPVTRETSVAHGIVSGRSVSVVYTLPGLFDTKMKEEQLVTEIARSVYLSSPGPHAFLIVFPLNMRFTEQEQKIPQQIEMMFGQEVLKYSIILFTHGDQLRGASVEKLMQESRELRRLLGECGGRFHVFNNKAQNNREQVNDLLQKIDSMIEQNGGGHYSNQMLEDALRFRREEEERKQQEKQTRVKIVRIIKKFGEEFEAKKRLGTEKRKAKILSEEAGAIMNFSRFSPSIRSPLFGSHCSRFCIWWSFD